jgi:acyl-CoA thioester hydrolase
MPYVARRRVEWADTDAAGIVHFSRFFIWMENSEHEMLRSLGLSVVMRETDNPIAAPGEHLGWPRVSVQCDFFRPLKHEDEFEVLVSLEKLGETSAHYRFDFMKDGQKLASGFSKSVCCRIIPGSPPKSTAIPEPVAEKLKTLLTEPS